MKRIGRFILLFLLLFTLVFTSNDYNTVYAIKAIPDGNATGSSFNPFDIDPTVKRDRWKVKGGKAYSNLSGKKLVYDVYSGESGESLKSGWNIANTNKGRGKEPFLQFYGWSALQSYHHHTRQNQATYLVAVNAKTNKEVMVKAEMTNLDAGKDMEFGKTTTNGPINNLCSNNTFNAISNTCNMRYEYVGFKAWLPLNDLFPNPNVNEDWILYIVKNVDGNIVYDELITPFAFNKLSFKNGDLSFDSGENTSSLKMNGTSVIRRSIPRGTNSNESGRYFTFGQTYQRVNQDEKAGAAIWYGVRSPHDNGSTRWTSSGFWTFGGTTARISYRIKQVDVTINHIDLDTNKIIGTEKKKVNLNNTFKAVPKPKGTFKDKDGNPYVASPVNQNFNEVIKGDKEIKFYYRVVLPDPSEEIEFPGDPDNSGGGSDGGGPGDSENPGSGGPDGDSRKQGSASGKAFWELTRNNVNESSSVYVESNFESNGDHYAIRNKKHSIDFAGKTIEKEGPITSIANGQSVKGESFDYKFQYEYTNYYRKNYECVEIQGEDCFKWEFINETPVWDKGKTFTLFGSIPIDHMQGDINKRNSLEEALNKKWLVGREDKWDYSQKTSKDYYEQWKFGENNETKSEYILKTQSTLPITPGELIYEVELPSDEHKKHSFNPFRKELSFGYYFPVDVDDSLKEDYNNNTSYTDFDYAFPLQQSLMDDNGLSGSSRTFLMEYATDLFFMSKHTGFISGYSYVDQLKDSHINQKELPSFNTLVEKGTNKLISDFESLTKHDFKDKVLYTANDAEFKKLQRYILPVSPDSPLKPKVNYKNHVVIENMGLNDGVIEYNQAYQFEHYLFGSGHDDVWVIEQVDSRTKLKPSDSSLINTVNIEYKDIKSIITENLGQPYIRMHGFRPSNRELINKTKAFVHF